MDAVHSGIKDRQIYWSIREKILVGFNNKVYFLFIPTMGWLGALLCLLIQGCRMNQQPPSTALISQAELKIRLEASHWPLKVSGLAMTCVTSARYP